MSWLFFIIASVVFVAISNILQRTILKNTKESNTFAYTLLFQFGFAFTILLVLLLTGGVSVSGIFIELSAKTLLLILVSAVLWAVSVVYKFKAVHIIEASILAVLTPLENIIIVILGVLLLHEVITTKTLFGMFLILFAVFLVIFADVNIKFNFKRLKNVSIKGIVFALISLISAGVAVVVDAMVLQTFPVLLYLFISSFLSSVLMLTFGKNAYNLQQIKSLFSSKGFYKMYLFVMFYVLQAIFYYQAFKVGGPISYISIISDFSIILTVIFAIIFLKERRFLFRKLLAGIISVLGIILLAGG